MPVTKEDIRAEHEAALASLNPAQLAALKRMNRSFLESHFANCSAKDMIEHVYEREAEERNSEAGAQPA